MPSALNHEPRTASLVDELADVLARCCWRGRRGAAIVKRGDDALDPLGLAREEMFVTIVPTGRMLMVAAPQTIRAGLWPRLAAVQDFAEEEVADEFDLDDVDLVLVDLVYQYKCGHHARQRVRTWLLEMETAITALRAGGLSVAGGARLLSVEQMPLFEQKHLLKFATFTSRLRCAYQIDRNQ